MKPLLKEIALSDLSRIEVHYYRGAANVKSYQTICRLSDLTFPTALVVGEKCKEAVRTLLLGVSSAEPIESVDT